MVGADVVVVEGDALVVVVAVGGAVVVLVAAAVATEAANGVSAARVRAGSVRTSAVKRLAPTSAAAASVMSGPRFEVALTVELSSSSRRRAAMSRSRRGRGHEWRGG